MVFFYQIKHDICDGLLNRNSLFISWIFFQTHSSSISLITIVTHKHTYQIIKSKEFIVIFAQETSRQETDGHSQSTY